MSYQITAQLELALPGSDQYCFVWVKSESGLDEQFIVSRDGEIVDSADMEIIPKDIEKIVKQKAKEEFDKNSDEMATIGNLIIYTQRFFKMHWNYQALCHEPPHWSCPVVVGGNSPLPNHDKRGVYAFVKGNTITYIGETTLNASGCYRSQDIGIHFQSFAQCVNGKYQVIDQRLIEAGRVMTLGFEVEEAYLANALKSYLVSKLYPRYNKN